MQVEGQLVGERDAAGDGSRVGCQRGRHLIPGAQVGRARQVEPAVEVGQAAAGADGGHRRGESRLSRCRVVDVAGRDHVEAVDGRQPGERGVGRVGPRARRQLDQHVLDPEERRQPVERLGRGGLAPSGQRLPHRALAAPGEHHPVAAPPLAELVEVVHGAALLVTAEVGVGHRGSEAVVALDAPCQHQQVAALGIGYAVLRAAQAEDSSAPKTVGRS